VGQRPDADQLGQIVLAMRRRHFGFEDGVLVFQPVARLLGFELRAHPGQHQDRLDRLGDVIGRAQQQASFLVVDVGQGGQEDHRDVCGGGVFVQASQYFVAVHAGHHHVEQHQIRPRRAGRRAQGAFSGVGGAHLIFRSQQMRQQRQVCGFVIDDQDGCLRHETGASGET
jgi:hypothetical protein